ETWPLEQLDLTGAMELQFRLVESIARHFDGNSILQAGDYGVQPGLGRPHTTARVEVVLAEFFGAEAACLVRGAGTGALRAILMALLRPGQSLLVHRAPIYPTTAVTIEAMGIALVQVDLNDLDALDKLNLSGVRLALLQHARQRIQDHYVLADVIARLKDRHPGLTVLVDDNYAALRVPRIGIQLGADISAFSLFKLLGPEGVGCALASRSLVEAIRRQHYSGGTQVQGVEALDALRALTYAPVALAVQGQVVAQVVARLNDRPVAGVVRAFAANAQSRVILVELDKPIARQAIDKCVEFGAANHPVGAESRYEVSPMFYRVSGTFLQDRPELADKMIRINPMRAGADLVVDILEKTLRACEGG
ncbi:MAG: aminotransferase class V-fold PLP-dependent enzyme, partial [Chloroflexi bacterium]|nr:aminotransferase class V-fold PLP-dependent enzyme [Chloroflexota bacterium]